MIAHLFQKYPEVFHTNYLQFCSYFPVKFGIFLKNSLPLNSFYCLSVYKQNLTAFLDGNCQAEELMLPTLELKEVSKEKTTQALVAKYVNSLNN